MTATIDTPGAVQGTAMLTVSAALNSALDLAMERDPKVIAIGEDISDLTGGSFKATKGLTNKHGEGRGWGRPASGQAHASAPRGGAGAG